MTINLEKALIKANKKLLTPKELLVVREYEQNAGLLNDDTLRRVGMDTNLTKGKQVKTRSETLKNETKRFDQSRVFHISQIKQTCLNYFLRFLPSDIYTGTIDSELPYKINAFEAAYGVRCGTSSCFIMAPASSFKLQEVPKDPLFFYKINEEYYYLIHKWGNDLNVFRRALPILSSTWFFYLSMILGVFMNLSSMKLDNDFTGLEAINAFSATVIIVTLIVITIHSVVDSEWPSWMKKNEFNSSYIK